MIGWLFRIYGGSKNEVLKLAFHATLRLAIGVNQSVATVFVIFLGHFFCFNDMTITLQSNHQDNCNECATVPRDLQMLVSIDFGVYINSHIDMHLCK